MAAAGMSALKFSQQKKMRKKGKIQRRNPGSVDLSRRDKEAQGMG